MAATDCTLLALAGTGHASRRSFGFASCNRAVGASEGMNVLQRRKRLVRDKDSGELVPQYEYGVTNVEYTEFTRLGIEDKTADGGTESAFPANTNILYVGTHLVLSVSASIG
jgi:UTP---glucose-1-phosphate uridylyltransferase